MPFYHLSIRVAQKLTVENSSFPQLILFQCIILMVIHPTKIPGSDWLKRGRHNLQSICLYLVNGHVEVVSCNCLCSFQRVVLGALHGAGVCFIFLFLSLNVVYLPIYVKLVLASVWQNKCQIARR